METSSATIDELLQEFDPISLQEAEEFKLLKRKESKYILNYDQFMVLLKHCTSEFKALTIRNKKLHAYQTFYYDDAKLSSYHDHQKGKPNRYKVRIRSYLASQLSFLEIKQKMSNGLKLKKREAMSFNEKELKENQLLFLSKELGEVAGLSNVITNQYQRINLVNNQRKERLTFDLGVTFSIPGHSISIEPMVIMELKEELQSVSSMVKIFKSLNIRPVSFSKYCIGMALLYPELKKNRFKETLLKVSQWKS